MIVLTNIKLHQSAMRDNSPASGSCYKNKTKKDESCVPQLERV